MKARLGQAASTPEVEDKMKTISGLIKEQKFLQSITRDDEYDKIKPEDLTIEASYDGPKLEKDEPITADWAKEALDYMQKQKKLHKKVVWSIVKRISAHLEKEPTLKEVSVPR